MNDSDARSLIINDIDSNLFVEAGAGSGKTTMLVERMTAMVERGLPVEKICTITFTKAAANEFYERFQKKLIERGKVSKDYSYPGYGLPMPTEESAARCRKALENIDLCFMGTIDAFCNMILSEHPMEAGVPGDCTLIDDKEEMELYRSFYVDAREGRFGKKLKEEAGYFASFFYNGEERFSILVKEVMDRRNVRFAFKKGSDESPFRFLKEDRESLIKILDSFDKDLSKLHLFIKDKTQEEQMDIYRDADIKLHRGWHYNYSGVQSALKNIASLSYDATPAQLGIEKEKFVREQDGQTVLNIADEDSSSCLIGKMREYKYYKTLSFLLDCIPYLEEKMRKAGKLTYFDYLFYLRNMLQKDAQEGGGKLIDHIYHRHSYFMIDEFQDTNPMQAEVFFHLAAEDPTVSEWRKCKPRPGSLFIVGDPKQSIYRFRNADVSSYIQIRELFQNGVGKVVDLVNNFRSKNVLKNYFNDRFEQMMPEDSADQSAYKDIENIASKQIDGEFDGVYFYVTYGGQALKDHPEMSDQDQLVNVIKALVGNKDHLLLETDRNKEDFGKLRKISYRDFMIIFASKKPIAGCISRFGKEKIPVKVEGKVLFEECEALKAIVSVYKTVTSLDAISLVDCLYGPLFGFNENDLASYKNEGKTISLDPYGEYEDEGIEAALQKLSATARKSIGLTPSSLFEEIIDTYEIYRYVPSDGMEVVYFVLELLRGQQTSGNIVTYSDAVSYLEELLSGESGIERCLSLKEDEDVVHIANLHKVKGLEAPIVILARSSTAAYSGDIRVDYSEEGENPKGYIITIGERLDNGRMSPLIETLQYPEEKDAEKESLKKEGDRLIYVAATRARNVLIVNRAKQLSSKGNLFDAKSRWKPLLEKIPESENILELIGTNEEYTVPEADEVRAKDLYEECETVEITNDPTYTNASPSTLMSFSKIEEDGPEREGVDETNGETYSTMIGTMVHRLMEMIIMSEDRLDKSKAVENIMAEYLMPEMKDYEESFRRTLNRVYEKMHQGGFPQRNGAMEDILPEILKAEEKYSEVPFTYREKDTVWNGIIDLVYVKDGKTHIIDWKTNKSDVGLSDHYREQLNAYKKALSQLAGVEAEDALIYHIDIQ